MYICAQGGACLVVEGSYLGQSVHFQTFLQLLISCSSFLRPNFSMIGTSLNDSLKPTFLSPSDASYALALAAGEMLLLVNVRLWLAVDVEYVQIRCLLVLIFLHRSALVKLPSHTSFIPPPFSLTLLCIFKIYLWPFNNLTIPIYIYICVPILLSPHPPISL